MAWHTVIVCLNIFFLDAKAFPAPTRLSLHHSHPHKLTSIHGPGLRALRWYRIYLKSFASLFQLFSYSFEHCRRNDNGFSFFTHNLFWDWRTWGGVTFVQNWAELNFHSKDSPFHHQQTFTGVLCSPGWALLDWAEQILHAASFPYYPQTGHSAMPSPIAADDTVTYYIRSYMQVIDRINRVPLQ